MKSRKFRWLFFGVLALVTTMALTSEQQTFGVSVAWTNDGYRFEGGTTPLGLAFAGITATLYILLMHSTSIDSGRPVSGVLRRFVAFWLDFMVAMLMIAPVIGVIPVFMEWDRTGIFAWNFERTTSTRGDLPLAVISILLTFAALPFYYAIPIFRSRPSPCACIAGYQVLADSGTCLTMRRALLRTLLGFIALSAWIVVPFVGRDQKRGKFWLDKIFYTHATLLP